MKKSLKLLLFIGICESVGMAGNVFTSQSIPNWYNTLKKPSINPPPWIFGPVWVVLYSMMGIAIYLVSEKKIQWQKSAIAIFFLQLALNFLWTFLFFGMRSPFAALIEIISLWIFIVLTIFSFWRINRRAALLMIPYLLWVSFASVLNFLFFKINKKCENTSFL